MHHRIDTNLNSPAKQQAAALVTARHSPIEHGSARNDAALRLLYREFLRETLCEENLTFYIDVNASAPKIISNVEPQEPLARNRGHRRLTRN